MDSDTYHWGGVYLVFFGLGSCNCFLVAHGTGPSVDSPFTIRHGLRRATRPRWA